MAAAAAAADKHALLAQQERLDSNLAMLQSTLEQEQAALQLKTAKAAELKEQLEEAFERMDMQVINSWLGYLHDRMLCRLLVATYARHTSELSFGLFDQCAWMTKFAVRTLQGSTALAMKETLRQQQDATSAAKSAAQAYAADAERLRGEKAALEQQAAEMQCRIRELVHQASDAQQEAAQEAAASARLSEQLTEAMHRIDELAASLAAAECGATDGQRALAQWDVEVAAKAQQEAALQEQLAEAQARSTKDAKLIATLRQEVLLSTAREQATSIGTLVEEVLGVLCSLCSFSHRAATPFTVQRCVFRAVDCMLQEPASGNLQHVARHICMWDGCCKDSVLRHLLALVLHAHTCLCVCTGRSNEAAGCG